MRGFLGALQFLTRVPVRTRVAPTLADAVPWFPVVGVVVGAAVGGVAVGMMELSTPFTAAAVAVVVGMLITGAFHEDGLADLADAVAGGWTRERRLEILKDPRHGTFGVAALCASVVVRVAAIAALVSRDQAAAFAAIVTAHALARATAVAAMPIVPTATPDGLGASFAHDLKPLHALAGTATAIAVAVVAGGPLWSAVLVLTAAVTGAIVLVISRRALGGITGDVLGAVEQVAEGATLIAASALASHLTLWW